MAKKQADNTVVKTRDRRFLMCALTDEELKQAADDLAMYLDDLQSLDSELATIKSQFKGRIEQCEANVNAKKRLVRDKKEMRPVEVEVESDYSACMIRVTRLDTGDVIESRPMTGDEKQLQMEFQEE